MHSGYSIVMFAHNEEKNIQSSVTSVLANVDEQLVDFTVLINGSSDNTAELVRELIQTDATGRLKVVELEMGDKCNAWNTYIHELACTAQMHFFLDADVRFTTNAFPMMFQKLMRDDMANAIAGLPFSGRNIKQYKEMVEEHKCLFGNCYGLTTRFIELIKSKGFRLPIGLGWIDSAITKIVNRDLEDISNPKGGKIIFDDNCGYEFDSLSLFKWNDCKLYVNRIVRYRLGKMQEKYLEKMSFTAWPLTLHEINANIMLDIESKSAWYNLIERKLVVNRIKKFTSNMPKLTPKENQC
jgi:glycosyltransferase involved in cell wall biosynthesis